MQLGTWKICSAVVLMDMLCSLYIMPWDKQWAYRKSNYLNRVYHVTGLTTFRDELVLPVSTT
uniref:Uncharacterized protein n=1 Tax=Triticum urartu TaxID=4572 RepID=A0A8R7V1W8_TRIUA